MKTIKDCIIKRDFNVIQNGNYTYEEMKIAMMFQEMLLDKGYNKFRNVYDSQTQDLGYEEIFDIVSSVYYAWNIQVNYFTVEETIQITSDETCAVEEYAERVLPLFIKEYFKKEI